MVFQRDVLSGFCVTVFVRQRRVQVHLSLAFRRREQVWFMLWFSALGQAELSRSIKVLDLEACRDRRRGPLLGYARMHRTVGSR